MTYDALGNRVRIVERNGSTIYNTRQFLFEGSTIAEERNASGAVTKQYFSQGMKVVSDYDNPGNVYYTRDHLGSIWETVFDQGYWRWSYDTSGNVLGLDLTLTGSFTFGDNPWYSDYAYAGMYVHDATALYLTKYRAYDALSARWLSRDPLQDVETQEGPNLYAYVRNNPANWIDSLGLQVLTSDIPYLGPAINDPPIHDQTVDILNTFLPSPEALAESVAASLGKTAACQMAKKADGKFIDYLAKKLGVDRRKLGDYIEDAKRGMGLPPNHHDKDLANQLGQEYKDSGGK